MDDLRMANIDKLTREIEAFLAGREAETPLPQPEDRDASWEVRVSDDLLRVYLDMYPAVGKGAPADPEAICLRIEQMGVRNLDHDKVLVLTDRCNSGDPASGEDAVIALGTPPISPVEGKIEFLVPMERTKRAEEEDGGAVDWKNLWTVPSVREGDVIARIHPPKEGTDGVDVYGKTLSAKSLAVFRSGTETACRSPR